MMHYKMLITIGLSTNVQLIDMRCIKNPMAKDVRQPKYKQQVIPDKKKPVLTRKKKHKGDSYEGQKS